jgi:TolB protein
MAEADPSLTDSVAAPAGGACGPAIGIFAGTSDVGAAQAGSTRYRPHVDTYELTGGGAEIGGTADAFHFAWRSCCGDGRIAAHPHFPARARPAREKAVLLFRQNLDPGSAYAGLVLQRDGRLTLQYRQSAAAVTFHVGVVHQGAGSLSLVRVGGQFTAFAAAAGAPLRPVAMIVLPLRDPLFAGIGVCSRDEERLATVGFSGVRIDAATEAE